MKEYTKDQILEIAKYQIKIIFLFIYCVLLNGGAATRYNVISLIFAGFLAFYIYRFAKALDLKFPAVIAILAFLPIVSLITLLILNQLATRALCHAGLRVTFFGGDKAELERYRNSKVWGSAK